LYSVTVQHIKPRQQSVRSAGSKTFCVKFICSIHCTEMRLNMIHGSLVTRMSSPVVITNFRIHIIRPLHRSPPLRQKPCKGLYPPMYSCGNKEVLNPMQRCSKHRYCLRHLLSCYTTVFLPHSSVPYLPRRRSKQIVSLEVINRHTQTSFHSIDPIRTLNERSNVVPLFCRGRVCLWRFELRYALSINRLRSLSSVQK